MNAAACSAIVLALAGAACQSLENTQSGVALREITASSQCAVNDAKLAVLADSAEASRLTGAYRIGAQPARWRIDDSRERLLLVAAGRKPSAGYRLQLTQADAALHDGVLHLPVTLSAPGEAYRAAVITSPCLLLAVQRGPYRRIVADDLGLELELDAD